MILSSVFFGGHEQSSQLRKEQVAGCHWNPDLSVANAHVGEKGSISDSEVAGPVVQSPPTITRVGPPVGCFFTRSCDNFLN
jgi:hypothetical protein